MSNGIIKKNPNGAIDKIDRRKQYYDVMPFKSRVLSDSSMLNDREKETITYALNKEWTNPKYKMHYFVGQAQITPYSKYRQWLLEVKSKEESIENIEYEIRKYEVEIRRFQRMADQAHDDLDRDMALIEKENAEKNIITSKRRLNDWYLERQHYLDLIYEFEESDEAILPDGTGRTYKDILNTDEEDIYEAEYWTNRLAKQAATDMLFYGRIGTGNMDAILSMSPEQQAETFALCINFSTKVKAYTTQLEHRAEEQLKLGADEPGELKDLLGPKEDNKQLSDQTEKQPEKESEGSINDVYNI